MELNEIDRELAEIDSTLRPLIARQSSLQAQRQKLLSKRFIEANAITLEDVEMSSDDGKPYFGMLPEFADWLKEHQSTKRFAEWNERICFTADLLAGKMPDMPATISDIPKESGDE